MFSTKQSWLGARILKAGRARWPNRAQPRQLLNTSERVDQRQTRLIEGKNKEYAKMEGIYLRRFTFLAPMPTGLWRSNSRSFSWHMAFLERIPTHQYASVSYTGVSFKNSNHKNGPPKMKNVRLCMIRSSSLSKTAANQSHFQRLEWLPSNLSVFG